MAAAKGSTGAIDVAAALVVTVLVPPEGDGVVTPVGIIVCMGLLVL